jgi:hypothetical protein
MTWPPHCTGLPNALTTDPSCACERHFLNSRGRLILCLVRAASVRSRNPMPTELMARYCRCIPAHSNFVPVTFTASAHV